MERFTEREKTTPRFRISEGGQLAVEWKGMRTLLGPPKATSLKSGPLSFRRKKERVYPERKLEKRGEKISHLKPGKKIVSQHSAWKKGRGKVAFSPIPRVKVALPQNACHPTYLLKKNLLPSRTRGPLKGEKLCSGGTKKRNPRPRAIKEKKVGKVLRLAPTL